MQTIILTPGEKFRVLVTRHAKKTGKDFDTIAAEIGYSDRTYLSKLFNLDTFNDRQAFLCAKYLEVSPLMFKPVSVMEDVLIQRLQTLEAGQESKLKMLQEMANELRLCHQRAWALSFEVERLTNEIDSLNRRILALEIENAALKTHTKN